MIPLLVRAAFFFLLIGSALLRAEIYFDSMASQRDIIEYSKNNKSFQDSNYFILEFKELNFYNILSLQDSGIEFLRYIPDNAALVKANSNKIARLDRSRLPIQRKLQYGPKLKVSKLLSNKNNVQSLLVKFFDARTAQQNLRYFYLYNLNEIQIWQEFILLQISTDYLYLLANINGVEWIEPAPELRDWGFGAANKKAVLHPLDFINKEQLLNNFKVFQEDPKRFVVKNKNQKKLTSRKNVSPDLDVSLIKDWSQDLEYLSGTKIMDYPSVVLQHNLKQNVQTHNHLSRTTSRLNSPLNKNQKQIIAIADTGVDTGQISSLSIHLQAVKAGKSYRNSSPIWEDLNGHGTHVAGLAVGRYALDGELKNMIHGTAPEAELFVQAIPADASGVIGIPLKFLEMYEEAYKEGVRIHSNSWGNPKAKATYDVLSMLLDRFSFQRPDMLILTAVGNDACDQNLDGYIDSNSVSSPATAKNTLSIGASKNFVQFYANQKMLSKLGELGKCFAQEPLASDRLSDNPKHMAAFSSRGPTKDLRLKPEIVAPGTNLLSTRSQMPGSSIMWGEFSKDYVFSGGSSMATPLVAGAAAVARSILQSKHSLASPSAASIKAFLMLNAHSIDTSDEQSLEINRNNLKQSLSQWQELESYFVAKNNNLDRSVHSVEDKKWMNQKANSDLTNKRNIDFAQGFGLLKFTDFYKNNITVIEESIFDGETQDTTSFQISENSRVQIILTYTDMPSALGVEKNLVNDLDLYLSLEDENKRTIKLAQSLSKTNNFEYMDLNLKPGKYKVSTDALRVLSPNGQSPYSLIVKIDTVN